MELQHVSIENPIPYPIQAITQTAENLAEESSEESKALVITEREEFVRRIEAFCDCV
ncbi:hypothetical protein MTYP_03124 [Methylophilaceae bacterium]|nr:hypothetical protein MTYP_03124 [Methylophilaceae bacterium]